MLSALLIGLAGSLHCVGMCAPLTLALPLPFGERLRVFAPLLIFHAGRILTYSMLGVVVGFLGKGLVLAGFQQIFSIVFGAAMLLSALAVFRWEAAVSVFPQVVFFSKKLKNWLSRAIRNRGLFAAGMLNGLLPCGMVYVALAGAISVSSGWQSAGYMIFFGIGTLPALLGVGLAGHFLNFKNRQRLRWVQPVLLAAAGLLLLQRGLKIDLSTWDSAVPQAGFDCH